MNRMHQVGFYVVCSVLLLFSATGCITPLPEAKARVATYYEDGSYDREVAKVLKEAERLLPPPGSYNAVGSAVVMDIDDTVLSTYEYQKALGFGHNGKLWHKWLELGRAKAIRPSLTFYLLAKERGLAVFFVSGRREKFRASTEENLRSTGFSDWQGLYMKPDDFRGASVVELKSSQRSDIERRGYKIIMNIGDQRSDLEGGHGGHPVLLPNLIYEVR